ncbi:BglG family transcription antiterminator [Wukongibacter sp. M2B1]|uniref:BglG family transcription antiterminator n=1 Tax=Wukongibacter sp. M2B1 TaxID=3088895 RepID=UPI003D78B3E2
MVELLITSRIKQILEIICDTSDSITIKKIAKRLGVSTRTILREMPTVEKWLKDNGFELVKKPRVGIKLVATLEDKKRLKVLLDSELVEKTFTPEERQSLIISELLERKEPTKLFYFASIFKVSEGTISHDLDKVGSWIKKYKLDLVRKPGLGVYLKGNEKAFRKAMINLLYENLDENQILNIIRQNLTVITKAQESIEISTKNRLMNLIDKEIIREIEMVIRDAEESLEYSLTDSSYAGLIVHLALAIQRIKNNEKITMQDDILTELIHSNEYEIAEKIANQISKYLEVDIPNDEIGYITMHLKGSKMRNGAYKNDFKDIDEFIIGNFELTKLVNEMIKIAENESGYSLKDNENLLVGLVSHLRPSIDRLKMNLDIRNPLLSKIKEIYPEIFEISKKSAQVINKRFNVEMPEAEIGFIAMHIGAAIEKKRQRVSKANRIYNVVVACTSGIGTSRLLATRLKKEFKNLRIVDTVSTVQIKEDWLKENEVDLIISTVYLDEGSASIVNVNPLLLEGDIKKIESTVEKLGAHRENIIKTNHKLDCDLKERASALRDYGEGIFEILEGFFFEENLNVNNIEQLIEHISNSIGSNREDIDSINNDLKAREKHGSTILSEKEIILLHCRTKGVNALKLGVVRISNENPIICLNGNGEEERIKTALVMMTPFDKNRRHLEAISEISRCMVDEPKFTDILVRGTSEDVYEEVNHILNRFLDSKINII